jgi:hypothetical protein
VGATDRRPSYEELAALVVRQAELSRSAQKAAVTTDGRVISNLNLDDWLDKG